MLTAPHRLVWCIVAVSAFVPCTARAQAVAQSFDELQHSLRVGQEVVVIDDSGRTTKGTVRDVSHTSITVGPSRFDETAIRELRVSDRLWNGALIGAAIGTGFATWDYAIDPSEPGNAAIFTVAIGLGSAIGAGIDALIKGKVLYRSKGKAAIAVTPLLSTMQRGATVTVRF